MASFVGHWLAPYALYRGFEHSLPEGSPKGLSAFLICGLLGILPDVDVLFRAVFRHRGATHSVLFSLGVSLVIWILWFRRGYQPEGMLPRGLLTFLLLFSCALIHPILDYWMACGPRLPFFWPFWKRGFLSGVQLIPTAYFAQDLRGLFKLLTYRPSLLGFALEFLIFCPLVLIPSVHGGWLKFGLVALSLTAVGCVALLYN